MKTAISKNNNKWRPVVINFYKVISIIIIYSKKICFKMTVYNLYHNLKMKNPLKQTYHISLHILKKNNKFKDSIHNLFLLMTIHTYKIKISNNI
jgi:hypothetical protein